MTTADHGEHMRRAIELAGRGLYTADPNPRVGCVLVNAGERVGEGWHVMAGGPHAERVALAAAGAAARGATAYVTLEPCNHTGRTGPCSDALIAAGVARVVCASRDPNPRVSGGGIDALRAAGIEVETGALETEARALNPGYWMRALRGRPLMRSKLAVSLDGRTALGNGVSQWLTGEAARADVHHWRARSSAVLTGIGTLLADNPSLDARLADSSVAVRQPSRIVLDTQLRTPLSAKTLSLPGERLIFTIASDPDKVAALAASGVKVERVDGNRECDLQAVARRLGELEFNEIWIEAGPRLNGALISAGLIDELVIYIAPMLLGNAARGMFDLGEFTALEHCPRLVLEEVVPVGADLRVIARPATLQNA